jgi:two-component system, chemotaxis family, chemotaxis protein CheY
MKILLVDDSNTMRRIQKNTLIQIGYEDVSEAADGKLAVDFLKANPGIDLVLMDWNMPNMTGIEALKVIKADPAINKIPVIMVTSESEKTRIIEAIQAGAANYVVKPFQPDTLKEKIVATIAK